MAACCSDDSWSSTMPASIISPRLPDNNCCSIILISCSSNNFKTHQMQDFSLFVEDFWRPSIHDKLILQSNIAHIVTALTFSAVIDTKEVVKLTFSFTGTCCAYCDVTTSNDLTILYLRKINRDMYLNNYVIHIL